MKRFKLRDEISRGVMCPRFHLPVYRRESHDRLVTWVFPLAPFALAGHIIASAWRTFWWDLFYFRDEMVESEKAREAWLASWSLNEEVKRLRKRIHELEGKGGEYGLDGSKVPPPSYFINERDIDKRRI